MRNNRGSCIYGKPAVGDASRVAAYRPTFACFCSRFFVRSYFRGTHHCPVAFLASEKLHWWKKHVFLFSSCFVCSSLKEWPCGVNASSQHYLFKNATFSLTECMLYCTRSWEIKTFLSRTKTTTGRHLGNTDHSSLSAEFSGERASASQS